MKTGVAMTIGILVVGILVAFTLPLAINGMSEPERQTYTQNVSDTVEIGAQLEATLDSVDSPNGTATVTLNDTKAGSTSTVTVLEGQNKSVAMPDGEVTIHNKNVTTSDATLQYDRPKDYNWDNASSNLFGLLPLFFVLSILLYVVGKATNKL